MPLVPEKIRELFNPSGPPSDLERELLVAGELVTAAAVYLAHKNDEASTPLVMVLAAQSVANGVMSAADVALNTETPHVTGSRRSIMAADFGLIMNINGRRMAETRPVLGKMLEIGGLAIGVSGAIKYGAPNLYGQIDAFLQGQRRPWVDRLSASSYTQAIPPDW